MSPRAKATTISFFAECVHYKLDGAYVITIGAWGKDNSLAPHELD